MVQERVSVQRSLYDQDYYLWLEATARFLEAGQLEKLDRENLLEEILDLGRRDQRKLESLLTRLWEHLLKLGYWRSELGRNQAHWRGEVTNFRVQIQRELKVSPSLRRYCEGVLEECYQDARRIVAQRAALPVELLPEEPISDLDQVLSLDWFPNPVQG